MSRAPRRSRRTEYGSALDSLRVKEKVRLTGTHVKLVQLEGDRELVEDNKSSNIREMKLISSESYHIISTRGNITLCANLFAIN